MVNPETVTEAFVKWLEDENIAVYEQDLFISQMAADNPDASWWVITSGGNPLQKLASGEVIQQFFVSLNYRNVDPEEVEKKLFSINQLLNTPGCLSLEGFEATEVSSSQYPVDSDLDNEDRQLGMLQADIKIYKKGQ